MSERLIIHDFAGIRDLEIDLKRINILIGPTASGKSICAKLCFYFKGLVAAIAQAVLWDKTWDDFVASMGTKFEDFFSSSAWQNTDSKVCYHIGELVIEITRDVNQKTLVNLPNEYRTVFVGLEEINRIEPTGPLLERNNSWLARDITKQHRLFEYLRKSFDSQSLGEQIFIPAGRSFFSNLESNIFNIFSTGASLDSFLISFGQSYENAKRDRRKLENLPDQTSALIQQLILKMSMGEYCHVDNNDCLRNLDGRVIQLKQGSSGQQEALPMLMLLENLLSELNLSGHKTVYIEEPEAHLFPKTQRDIVNLIAGIFRESQLDLQFFITTHSPYILTAFNNLLQASEVHRHDLSPIDRQTLEAIVPEALGLAIDDIAVYSLSNGQCHNLISQDLGLIDTSIIDDVSNEMSIEFGQLLDLAG